MTHQPEASVASVTSKADLCEDGAHKSVSESTPILSNAVATASYHAIDSSEQQQQQPVSGIDESRGSASGAASGASPLFHAQMPRKADSADKPSRPGTAMERQSWIRRLAHRYGAIELDNKGSTARDHLALG